MIEEEEPPANFPSDDAQCIEAMVSGLSKVILAGGIAMFLFLTGFGLKSWLIGHSEPAAAPQPLYLVPQFTPRIQPDDEAPDSQTQGERL